MSGAEAKAREIISKLSKKDLIFQWELTTISEDDHIGIVRGWLMDEFERRYPEGYNKWLSLEFPEDEELKNFI